MVADSGIVCGVLMNHPGALAALGGAVHQPPYKAPPKAPVLYLKPRHTRLAPGAAPVIAAESGAMWAEVSLGIVFARDARRVPAHDVARVIGGYAVVVDFSMPHESFYRPSVRWRARDASLALGAVAPLAADPDALDVRVSIDGTVVERSRTAGRVRGVARLIEDVTAFMSFAPGNVLLLGPAHPPPLLRPGQRLHAHIDGLPPLELPPAVPENLR